MRMQREKHLFFESIMRDDRSILDVLTGDYTFVNESSPNIRRSEVRAIRFAACLAGTQRRACYAW